MVLMARASARTSPARMRSTQCWIVPSECNILFPILSKPLFHRKGRKGREEEQRLKPRPKTNNARTTYFCFIRLHRIGGRDLTLVAEKMSQAIHQSLYAVL